jgi:hypothetical protein
LATLCKPLISLVKDVLVPQTPEQAQVLAVIVSACLQTNSISLSPSQIDWASGSSYGTAAGAWTVRLVPTKAGLELYLNDQPVTEVATTWYDWIDHAQEAAKAHEDDEGQRAPAAIVATAPVPVLVRLNDKGAVVEERLAKRGRAPKGFIRGFKAADGQIVDGEGKPVGPWPTG